MAMGGGRFDYTSVVIRFLFSLFFVLATYNPSGVSYFHWVLSASDLPLKLLVGLILVGVYAILIISTWRMIGWFGVSLVATTCATAGWVLWELGVVDLGSLSAFSTSVLVMLAVVFTAGISYSGAHTRLTGILHIENK
ncbi:hypothetical protein STAQ_40710 [Allostella sp. ATCC 35155]|nr:hypothetical protein STAQ_40710 [Stella sp. ATCC 35155]